MYDDDDPTWEQEFWTGYERYFNEFGPYGPQQETDMGLTASAKGGDFELCPAGTFVARCIGVFDIGTQTGPYGSQHQCILMWELPGELMADGRPFAISAFYTVSVHEKSNLGQHLAAWRGRDFTEDERAAFDIFNVIGHVCQLSITHKVKQNGDVKAVVQSVAKLMKGVECPVQVNPSRRFSFEDGQPPADDIPEWILDKIKAAPEFSGGNVVRHPAATDVSPTDDEFSDPIPF